MELAALIISVISLTATVGWGVATYLLSGSRVRVEARGAFPVGVGSTGLHVGVTVRNVGRTAVTVTGWGLKAGDMALVLLRPPPWHPPVPYRLEPGDEVAWYYPVEELSEPRPSTVKGYATLGTGGDARLSEDYSLRLDAGT